MSIKRSAARVSLASGNPRSAPRNKDKAGTRKFLPDPCTSIVNDMSERIKRVSKSYWGIVFLWAVTSIGEPVTWLTVASGVVIGGYLIWKMVGEADE